MPTRLRLSACAADAGITDAACLRPANDASEDNPVLVEAWAPPASSDSGTVMMVSCCVVLAWMPAQNGSGWMVARPLRVREGDPNVAAEVEAEALPLAPSTALDDDEAVPPDD